MPVPADEQLTPDSSGYREDGGEFTAAVDGSADNSSPAPLVPALLAPTWMGKEPSCLFSPSFDSGGDKGDKGNEGLLLLTRLGS